MNHLHLNLQKSEFILLGSKVMLNKCNEHNITITIWQTIIPVKSVVRDLGVFLDGALTMNNEMSHILKKAFSHIRLIARCSQYMSPLIRMIAVRSLVLPHVDVAIATLGGVASKQLKRLQTLLNSSMVSSGVMMLVLF